MTDSKMADPSGMGMMQAMMGQRAQAGAFRPSQGPTQAGHIMQMRDQIAQRHQAQMMQGQVQAPPMLGVQGGSQFNAGQMKQNAAAQMMRQGIPYQATMQRQAQPYAPVNMGMPQGMDMRQMRQNALTGLAKQAAPRFTAGGAPTRPGVMWRGD